MFAHFKEFWLPSHHLSLCEFFFILPLFGIYILVISDCRTFFFFKSFSFFRMEVTVLEGV